MEALRLNMEQGVTLVKDHIASLEFRGDTKASLLIGVCVGLVVVSIIAAYPGKPIDYSGVGVNMPAEMQGESSLSAAKAKKDDPVTADDNPETVVQGKQKAGAGAGGGGGLKQIQGVVDSMSDLRRRKAAAQASEKAAAISSKGGKQGGAGAVTEKGARTGNWDAMKLDENKLARKIGSSKAARMLGLTEEQVRQAVLDAREELERDQQQRGQSRAGGNTGNGGSPGHGGGIDDAGIGFSGVFSLAVLIVFLGAAWLFVSENPHAPLSRFLIGFFPREMETLGLSG
eukprot:jgi/Undpi1/7497/HiC_scaffold_22.g09970.m1